jgi:hypothetical protein
VRMPYSGMIRVAVLFGDGPLFGGCSKRLSKTRLKAANYPVEAEFKNFYEATFGRNSGVLNREPP